MEFSLDLFKMGNVIAYKHEGKGKFGRAIVRKQLAEGFVENDAQYSHVEISLGEQHSINVAPPKAKFIEITKKHAGRYIRLLEYRHDIDNKRFKVAALYAALCSNQSYDISGVLSFMFKWIKQNNRLFFCSEACATAYQMVYKDPMPFFGEKPSSIYPAHFFLPSFFCTKWEGRIPVQLLNT